MDLIVENGCRCRRARRSTRSGFRPCARRPPRSSRRHPRRTEAVGGGGKHACALNRGGEPVGERLPLLLKHVRDHDVRALGDEAARVAGAHSTGTARDDHCSIVETFHGLVSLRCVASTAARNFGSDQACVVVRSIGVISGKMAWISLKMGSTRMLPFAPIVVSTVGTPRAFAIAARPLP